VSIHCFSAILIKTREYFHKSESVYYHWKTVHISLIDIVISIVLKSVKSH